MGLRERSQREDMERATAANFDEFWRLFPRKVGKLDALKAWKQMTRDYAPADIIAGLQANLPALMRKERQFIKHPAGWLREGRWLDEPETAPRSTGNGLIDAIMGRMQ